MLASTPTISRSPTGAPTDAATGGETGASARGAVPRPCPRGDAAVLQAARARAGPARCSRRAPAAQLLIAIDIAAGARVRSSLAVLLRPISTRERPLDRAAMDPDPEPLGDQLHQIRRAQPGIGRRSRSRANATTSSVSLCARRGPGRAGTSAGQPARVQRGGRLIERRAREPERLRRARDRLAVDPHAADHLVLHLHQVTRRRGTPRRRTARRCTASGRGFKLRSARNASTFGSPPSRAIASSLE